MSGLRWSRRNFLKQTGTWVGAGLLQPVLPLIESGKSIAAAYPEELLSIEKFTKGKIKPGMIISKDNAELVKDISPEGLYLELQRGAQIKIAEATTAPDAIIAPYWVQATLRNKGKAVLDKKGQLWTEDGQPWIGGDPFPQARSGLEAMWNHKSNLTRYDDVREIASERNIDSSGELVREGSAFVVAIQTVGRLAKEPRPTIPGHKDEHYRAVLTFLKPFDVYGLASLSIVYYDNTRLPDTELYIPALRRTRRVPSTQRFEPASPYSALFISDLGLHNDPLLTWSWTLVGRKPMLAPSPSNKGHFASPGNQDPFTFLESNDKFPRSTWELRPEMLIVDGIPPAESPYGKKRMYIDAIYNRAQTADIWDRAGRLWKFLLFILCDTGVPDNMGSTARELSGVMFVDLQKDYHSNYFPQRRIGDIEFAVNAGFRIEDWATPTAMLSRGRR
jgi:Protein of unknown function (DUF1329)